MKNVQIHFFAIASEYVSAATSESSNTSTGADTSLVCSAPPWYMDTTAFGRHRLPPDSNDWTSMKWPRYSMLASLISPSPAREGDMSEANIEYRGHFIDVQSFESGGKRWRPKAVVSIYQGGALQTRLVSAPVEVLLDSEVAADTYSLAMAKKWIDDQLEGGRLEGKTEKQDAPGVREHPRGLDPPPSPDREERR